MRRDAASAADLVDMMSQRLALYLALLTVSSRKGDEVHAASVHIVHAYRHYPLEMNSIFAGIVYSCCTHYDVCFLKYRVEQCDLYVRDAVLNDQLECIDCVILSRERDREPFQCERSLVYRVGAVSSVEREAPV